MWGISYVHKIAPFVHFQTMFSNLWILYYIYKCVVFWMPIFVRWAGVQKTPNFHGIIWNHEKPFHHIQLKPFGAFLTPGRLPNKSPTNWLIPGVTSHDAPRSGQPPAWPSFLVTWTRQSLSSALFLKQMSSVHGVLLKTRVNRLWIAHLGDDDYLVKTTLRFLWSTRICRDSIFNVLSTKSCPVGRLWWLERLNMCQSSLYLWLRR